MMAAGCGCARSCCGGSLGVLRRLEGMGALGMGGVDAGECDQLFTIHWTTDSLVAFRKRLAPWFLATNAAITTCTTLAPEERAAWSLFYQSWTDHLAADVSWWDMRGEWVALCAFSKSLDAWRTTVEGKCVIPGPKQIESPKTEEVFAAVKWGAAAVIVAAVVYGVTRVL